MQLLQHIVSHRKAFETAGLLVTRSCTVNSAAPAYVAALSNSSLHSNLTCSTVDYDALSNCPNKTTSGKTRTLAAEHTERWYLLNPETSLQV